MKRCRCRGARRARAAAADWLSSSSRLRVNLTATSGRGARSSGLFSTDTIASFDWQLAIGDTTLSEDQLLELAAAKEPLIRVRGRWHALRRSDVERALRFLERRRSDVGVVDLFRAVSGLETDEAGLELGEVTLDDSLADLLAGGDERRFHPLPTPAGMSHPLFPFQERGHGWLRMLGDLGVGAILADDMGLGKTVQAIATFVSEREQAGAKALGPTLVVCPMSVTRQWMKEIARFAPSLRAYLHHGSDRLAGAELAAAAHGQRRRRHLIRRRHTRRRRSRLGYRDRLLLDEAQDVKNPATKRAPRCAGSRARQAAGDAGTQMKIGSAISGR